jgi:chromosome segregation ATPase
MQGAMIMPNDKKKTVAITCQDQYFFRWQRNQWTESTILKLKKDLDHTQRLIQQQQQDIEQNKKSIAKSTLSGLREDIATLKKILEKNERICENAVRKKEALEDLTDRRQLIAETKIEINNKTVLIKEISESPDKILPAAKAAQIFIPKQEEQLKKLQQKANDLNKELVSKMAQLENDRVYVQFFQSALSKHIASVLDKTFKIPMLETPRPSAHKR